MSTSITAADLVTGTLIVRGDRIYKVARVRDDGFTAQLVLPQQHPASTHRFGMAPPQVGQRRLWGWIGQFSICDGAEYDRVALHWGLDPIGDWLCPQRTPQETGMCWVSAFPEDEQAMLSRTLVIGQTYRLVTCLVSDSTAASPSEYRHSKVRFEVLARGAGACRADDDGVFLDRVRSDVVVCEHDGTELFAVDLRAEETGHARIEVQITVDGIPIDNAHLFEFDVVNPTVLGIAI